MQEEQQDATKQEDSPSNASISKLQDARNKAMKALVPIINNITDVEPERRFDISLKAMRFTEDSSLVDSVLDAALAIKNESAKAEALVELINEIDYLESP
jgi:hypothetical protein